MVKKVIIADILKKLEIKKLKPKKKEIITKEMTKNPDADWQRHQERGSQRQHHGNQHVSRPLQRSEEHEVEAEHGEAPGLVDQQLASDPDHLGIVGEGREQRYAKREEQQGRTPEQRQVCHEPHAERAPGARDVARSQILADQRRAGAGHGE